MISNNEVIIHVRAEKNYNSSIQSLLASRSHNHPKVQETKLSDLWGSHSYGLQNVSFFKELNEENKKSILEKAARDRLQEAYHIEKSGMIYTAKMCLLSQSIDERKLYSLFSEDEARHLTYIEQVLDDVGDSDQNPFLTLLAEMIETGRQRPLIFIIQILLEGWGIEHYTKMSQECLNNTFSKLLQTIVKDEASHHGSGLMMFNEKDLSTQEMDFILETLVRFFEMVQIGPVGLLFTLEENLGHLSKSQKINILDNLDAQANTQQKLDSLKKLIFKSNSAKIYEHFEKYGSFKAWSHQKTIETILH
jgi:rubrerythrin